MMTPDGKWHLSPAYDMMFTVDPDTTFYRNHELSICGKTSGISRKDMLTFASKQDIKNASNIIDDITASVMKFKDYALQVGINDTWIKKIESILAENIRDI